MRITRRFSLPALLAPALAVTLAGVALPLAGSLDTAQAAQPAGLTQDARLAAAHGAITYPERRRDKRRPTSRPTPRPTTPTTRPTTPTATPTPRPTTSTTSPNTPSPTSPTTASPTGSTRTLFDPALRDVAFQILCSAENSSLNWRGQYGYIEYNVEGNAAENRGYTAGIMGFTSKTHDMLVLVRNYVAAAPTNNLLAPYLPALQRVDGSSSTSGLGAGFVAAWKASAADARFRKAQDDLADSMYFTPAVTQAISDGLGPLGQFAYFDAMVMHGPGSDSMSFGGIRAAALRAARTPAAGGDQSAYLNAFLNARVAAMKAEEGHSDVSRVETAQRVWLRAGNLTLTLPLTWSVYGDRYTITR